MAAAVLGFAVTGLRAGAELNRDVAAACRDVREALDGHGIRAAMLGSVLEAAEFHAALVGVLAELAGDAGAEADRRADLASRAGRAAGLGAGLVRETTGAAGAVWSAGLRS